jgi:uncharacterized phage-associated protein
MAKLSALDVAKYFLALIDEDSGDSITNLKLQKLVYYAQGFSLAILSKPLFSDTIQAWEHGPVIPSVYDKYKKHGARNIPKPKRVDFSIYSDQTKDLLNEVYEAYGQFSAWRLRELTHKEPPWKNAYPNGVITQKALKKFFKKLIA